MELATLTVSFKYCGRAGAKNDEGMYTVATTITIEYKDCEVVGTYIIIHALGTHAQGTSCAIV